jgi:hypothetical protein
MPRTAPSEDLVDLIYDAALEPELWDRALVGVADALNSLSGILTGMSEADGVANFAFAYFGRLDPEFNLRHASLGLNENPWMPTLSPQPIGRIVSSDEILPLAEARGTAFYREVITPQDDEHVLMTNLMHQDGIACSFFLARSVRKGPYDEHEVRLLEELVPHLRRATMLFWRTKAYQVLAKDQQQLLDLIDIGIVLIDAFGRARCVNRAAENIVRQDEGLTLRRSVVCAHDPAANEELINLIAATAAGGAGGTVGLPRTESNLPLIVLVCPLRGKLREHNLLNRSPVALFVSDGSHHNRAEVIDVLRQI